MSIKCGNCGNYHASVSEVRACHALENSIANRDTGYFAEAFDPAQSIETPAQRDARRAAVVAEVESRRKTRELISQVIPRAPYRAAYDLEEGFYSLDSQIFKVQRNLEGTRKYAKVLELSDVDDNGHTARWEYAAGAISNLRPEMKLTESDAASFGKLYGICCICSARLTNEKSIDRGIGPICADKQGW